MDDIWKPPVEAMELPRFFTRTVVGVLLVAAFTGALLGAAWGMLLGYARPSLFFARGEVALEPGAFGRTPEGQKRWMAKLDDFSGMVDVLNDLGKANDQESLQCTFDREQARFSVEVTSVTRSLPTDAVKRLLTILEGNILHIQGATPEEVHALDRAVAKLNGDSLLFTDNERMVETATALDAGELKAIADSPELSKQFALWKKDCAKVESMKESLRAKQNEEVLAISKVVSGPGEPVELEKPSMAPDVALRSTVVGAGMTGAALLILWIRYRMRNREHNALAAEEAESRKVEY